jgi:hypothetical protein
MQGREETLSDRHEIIAGEGIGGASASPVWGESLACMDFRFDKGLGLALLLETVERLFSKLASAQHRHQTAWL